MATAHDETGDAHGDGVLCADELLVAVGNYPKYHDATRMYEAPDLGGQCIYELLSVVLCSGDAIAEVCHYLCFHSRTTSDRLTSPHWVHVGEGRPLLSAGQ